jgi:copper(I)-binding protein
MSPRLLLIPALCALALAIPRAAAAQPAVKAVSAWVAVPAAGATTADAFVEVANPTMYEIYVTGATADLAASVELRGAAKGGEAPVVTDFAVPAYGSVDAVASAPHLRLVNLSRALKAGDTVALTLTTDGGAQLKVAAIVKAP